MNATGPAEAVGGRARATLATSRCRAGAQEERERLVHALLVLLGAAVFGLLAAAALTGAIVVL